MNIPFTRWYPAIEKRISRRQYDFSKAIPSSVLEGLQNVCTEFRPFDGVRTELITTGFDTVFTGFIGSYGKISGARAAVIFIGDTRDEYVNEKTGYTGEGIILEATAAELGTCWIGGTFNSKVAASLVDLSGHEKVFGVSPLGYPLPSKTMSERIMSGFARSRKRKDLTAMLSDNNNNGYRDWVENALEAARKAPSAVNRQPWHFHLEKDSITVSSGNSIPGDIISRRLDCGIAMLHFEVAALNSGVTGHWEFLNKPQVARFQASQPVF